MSDTLAHGDSSINRALINVCVHTNACTHTHLGMKRKPTGATRRHCSRESCVVEVKGFPEPKFVKVTKLACSPHSPMVRYFNTSSEVNVFKKHLGALGDPSPLPRRERQIQQIGRGPRT